MSTVDKLTGKRCDKELRCACFVSPQRTQRFTENFLCLSRRVIFKLCVTLCPLWCILFSGCDRRELTYSDEAEITLTADWSKAGLSEQEAQYGATAVFYPTDGSTPDYRADGRPQPQDRPDERGMLQRSPVQPFVRRL